MFCLTHIIIIIIIIIITIITTTKEMHITKVCRGSRGAAPLTVNLSTSCGLVIYRRFSI